MSRVRVRFAPSPTGHLHVGGARTALFNWLFARHHQGAFIIRVEDTDVERSTLESEQMVLADLRWRGFSWDEGPDVGGSYGPYRQSERRAIYDHAARQLIESGHAYRCFCLEEDLQRKREEAEASGRAPHYDLTCFRLEPEEIGRRLHAGQSFVVRFHVPKDEGGNAGDVTIHDLIREEVHWKAEMLGDFIILRSDGMPTYNFSVVVDDHEMEITHVIRAEEHLTNTHRQVLLYRAFGWPVPELAHVSLILGEDRSKLSKRHGATSVAAFEEEGFLPEAMVNYLTLLGWSPPSGEEIFSPDYAIEQFALDRINPSPAIFDRTKLVWMNGQYLHIADPERLASLVEKDLATRGLIEPGSGAARTWLVDVVEFLRIKVQTLVELADLVASLFHYVPEEVVANPENREVLAADGAKRVIALLGEELRENGSPETPEQYQALAEKVKAKSGQKGKALFGPMRVALTGSAHGPELLRLVPLLERGSRTAGLSSILPPAERVVALLRVLG
ncbi:MAG TPA: glutamate--tRNA ligase [Thermoanaerobaculia bacterium]|nr:glutamate--tRNA ligase [Thermoanaerobaculia bacterium]